MRDQAQILSLIAQEAIMGIVAFPAIGGSCLYINRLASEVLEVQGVDSEVLQIRKDGTVETLHAGFASSNDDGTQIPLELEDLLSNESKPGFGRGFTVDLLQNEGLYQDVLMKKKNGHMFVANLGVKHSELANGETVIVLMFQDITVQKKLQRDIQAKQEEIHRAFTELLQQNEQLKQLDQAKDKFLALTSHELRTPLSAIVATAEVLTLGLYENEQQKEDFIQTIHAQGLELMELINDILDFAKIRAGKMDFYVESFDIGAMVGRLIANYEQAAAQASVSFDWSAPSTPVFAWADRLRIKEVVNNVLSNAVKYNSAGGRVVVRVESVGLGVRADGGGLGAAESGAIRSESGAGELGAGELGAGESGRLSAESVVNGSELGLVSGVEIGAMSSQSSDSGFIRIRITDTGPGIPEDRLSAVFNEFETVGHISRHQKGTGLGMPISKKLMTGIGGDLTLESRVGTGSTFMIDIPVTKVLPPEVYRSRPDNDDDLAA